MAVVLVAALDCTLLRLPLSGRPLVSIMLLLGGLPTASLLALALIPLMSQRAASWLSRPFWLGFEIGGLLALLVFVACAARHSNDMRELLVHVLGSAGVSVQWMFPAAGLMLLAPQVLLAAIGGKVSEHVVRLVVETERPPAHRANGSAGNPASRIGPAASRRRRWA
jgi:hypothetical protein